jgi:protein-tyrosine-phosphatase
MPHVLIVSTAGVCRSPYAAILLAERLRSRSDSAWSVTSAGTDALPGEQLCTLASERLATEGLLDQAMAHESRLLTRDQIEAADVVLTAGAEHRAEVARLVPRASMRSFTLIEAVRLGALLPVPVSRGDGAVPLGDLLGELQAARPRLGRATPLPRSRRFSTSAIDIWHGHAGSAGDHRTALERVHEAVDAVADLLGGTR